MLGPSVTWYLAVAAFLFATGAFSVHGGGWFVNLVALARRRLDLDVDKLSFLRG